MCLAIPGKLIDIQQDAAAVRMGRANFGGITKQVCLEYAPDARLGDYILVHVGFAIGTVNPIEAARTFEALEELKQLSELDTPEIVEGQNSKVEDGPATAPPALDPRNSSLDNIDEIPG